MMFQAVYDKMRRNRPPSTISTAEPRYGHVVCILQVHAPTSSCPTLSAKAEPISKRHCQK